MIVVPDRVVCLGCGGSVVEAGRVPGEGEPVCSCARDHAEAAEVSCPSCGGSLAVGVRACPYCRCTLATTRCGHCSAWSLSGAQHCHRCGRAHGRESQGGAGEGASGRAAEGPCPRCGAALWPRMYAELDVDECDRCGGLFVEAEMLRRLIAERALPGAHGLHLALPQRARSRDHDVRYVQCPACHKHMNRQVFARVSGVIVDVCKTHGVWFDAGELADALTFVEKGGMAKARRRELDQLIEERRSLRAAELKSTAAPIPVDPSRDVGTSWGDFAAGLIDLWT